MKRLFLLLALIMGSCACEEKPTPTPIPIPEPEPEPTPVEEAVRVPFQSEITHVQPMTGIVLWNTSGSVKKDYVQLEYSYMLYNDVCKEKDVFDWTPMDKLLEQVAARGHQAVVRFRYTYPGYASAVPDYITLYVPVYHERYVLLRQQFGDYELSAFSFSWNDPLYPG